MHGNDGYIQDDITMHGNDGYIQDDITMHGNDAWQRRGYIAYNVA